MQIEKVLYAGIVVHIVLFCKCARFCAECRIFAMVMLWESNELGGEVKDL